MSGQITYEKIGEYNYSRDMLLGSGATGKVYKGYSCITYESVAVKAIDLSQMKDEATRSLLQNQKRALKLVSNPNVIKLLDIIEDNGFCYIVTEECKGGSLAEYIKKKKNLTEEEAMGIFGKILNGALALTEKCIIHRDLKPSNIMLRENKEPVIIDLGFCQIINFKTVMKTFNVGSPSYMSPEAYFKTLYSEKSDSWALAATYYEMLTGKTPDQGIPTKQYFAKLKETRAPSLQYQNVQISEFSKQLIEKALRVLPEERSSINSMKYSIDSKTMSKKKISSTVISSKTINWRQNQQNNMKDTFPTQKVIKFATIHTPTHPHKEMPETKIFRPEKDSKKMHFQIPRAVESCRASLEKKKQHRLQININEHSCKNIYTDGLLATNRNFIKNNFCQPLVNQSPANKRILKFSPSKPLSSTDHSFYSKTNFRSEFELQYKSPLNISNSQSNVHVGINPLPFGYENIGNDVKILKQATTDNDRLRYITTVKCIPREVPKFLNKSSNAIKGMRPQNLLGRPPHPMPHHAYKQSSPCLLVRQN